MKIAGVSTVLLFATAQLGAAFTTPLYAAKPIKGKPAKKKVIVKAPQKKSLPRKGPVKKAAAPAKKGKVVAKKAVTAKALPKKVIPKKTVAAKASPKKPSFGKGPVKKVAAPARKGKVVAKKTVVTGEAPPKSLFARAPTRDLSFFARKTNKPSIALPSLIGPAGPVGAAGVAMNVIKPLFGFEAKVQAGVLVFVSDIVGAPFRCNTDKLRKSLKLQISAGKPVMYTYGLSPFSGEAKKLVEDYDVEIVEVGPEWFVLGAEGSETRLVLAENSPNKQTSLPHLFAKGESLGGLSTGGRDGSGISGLVKSGAIDKVLKRNKKRVVPTKRR